MSFNRAFSILIVAIIVVIVVLRFAQLAGFIAHSMSAAERHSPQGAA